MVRAIFGAAGLAAGVSAAILPRQQCCFELSASGGQSGTVGQLDDGQNRIGGGLPAGSYCINNGAITDSNGRGCILTPPTTQFQCDTGASPTTGFSVSSSGVVEYNGSSTFYACGAAPGEYNIYTTPVQGQTDCVEITLSTGGQCSGSGNGASSSAPSAPAYSAPSSQQPAPSVPSYSQPSQQPAPTAPSYSQPSQQPAPSYSQPSQQPGPSVPSYSQPSQPAPSAPSYSQPSQQPGPSVPSYSQPSPQPSAPSYSAPPQQPAPSPPSYSQPSVSIPVVTCPTSRVTVYQTVTYTSSVAYGTPPAYSTGSQPAPSGSQPAPSGSQPAPSGSQPAPSGSQPAPSGTQPAGYASACQTSLTGAYQTPHLIVPVSSSQPDTAYGTQYNATISSDECTIFNFDVPQSYAGQSCSVVFLFPEQSQLETSSFTFSGSGDLVFSELSSAADEQTTWNNCPSTGDKLGNVTPQPGNSYAISTESCAAGTTQSIEVCSANGLSLEYFQDWNPSPIGVYITSC